MEGMLRQLINHDIELTITCGEKVASVKADPGYLGQVLMNLVINARDAMPAGGKLSIAVSNVELDAGYATGHPGVVRGDHVMLTISDTGTGMSDEIKARTFEPFFTTKPKGKGTGLGLATCQTIVQQSGGHIDLHSEVGKGTTFRIYFPRVTERPKFTARPTQRKPMPRGTETILVVEDDPEVRHLVCVVLRAQGYELLEAKGRDGLRTLVDNKAPAIRLVITDVVMPQLAEWLEIKKPDLKFLFTSGYAKGAITHPGALEPRIAFLAKPYSLDTLARKVRELLDAPPLASVIAGGASVTASVIGADGVEGTRR
jgi:CheY-like chemotaxis protein